MDKLRSIEQSLSLLTRNKTTFVQLQRCQKRSRFVREERQAFAKPGDGKPKEIRQPDKQKAFRAKAAGLFWKKSGKFSGFLKTVSCFENEAEFRGEVLQKGWLAGNANLAKKEGENKSVFPSAGTVKLGLGRTTFKKFSYSNYASIHLL